MGESQDPDFDLVQRTREGDELAFEQLVRRYQQKIFSTCYHWNFAGRTNAEDATQETFIRAFKGIKKFRGETKFEYWLQRIAINVCKSQRTKLRREKSVAPFTDVESKTTNKDGKVLRFEDTVPNGGPNDTDRLMARDLILKCLERLSEVRRTLISLVCLNDYSYQEASAILDMPINTVRSNLNRAIKQDLKKCLEEMGLLDVR
jgi:RNA polymerase sigma-70 factor, ECF subfamily